MSCSRTLAGLVREVCRKVPPERSMVRTTFHSRGMTQAALASGSPPIR